MTDTAPEPPADPPEGGFFSRELGKILPHAEHAEADASRIAVSVSAALRDHAGSVFDVSGDVLSLLGMIDPADGALFAAARALEPKVYAMVEKAVALAQAALKGG